MKFSSALIPYLRPVTGVGTMMREVCLVLVPAIVVYVFFFGWGILFNLALCVTACIGFEALALRWRGQQIAAVLGDYSVCLTAVLIAFALPPYVPVYVTITACGFAVLVAKHAYGGLGFNTFNPAMVGYAVALVSFPVEMSTWLPPMLGDIDYVRPDALASAHYLFTGDWPAPFTLDGLSQATPLDRVRTGMRESELFAEMRTHPIFGDFGGAGWEWIGNFIAVAGAWLLYRGVIRWHIPVAVLAGILIPAALQSAMSSGAYPGAGFHLFSGATLLGAFFIATDPVSAATSPRGRLIYGAGIGILTWVIRTYGGYPDGFAFAVLLMNAAVPLIDRLTVPRVMGHSNG